MKNWIILLCMSLFALGSCTKPGPDDSGKDTPFMSLEQTSYSIDAEGGSLLIVVSSNIDFNAINDIEWASLSDGQKSGEKISYNLTVEPNKETSQRSGSIRFIGEGVKAVKVTVTQKAYIPTGIDKENISVDFDATSAEIQVLGDKEWTIKTNNPAFTCSPSSGNGNTDVVISFPANASTSPVNVVITVSMAGKEYTCNLTQKGKPTASNPTDLTEKGTANCYVVTKPGYYKFKATVRGNGVPVPSTPEIAASISPASLKVLWATYNTETAPASTAEVITDLKLDNGYAVFATADSLVPGNALIAAVDGSGTILWSWHIWIRTSEPTVISEAGSEWLDWNLGAVTNELCLPTSNGLYYQWGNKNPMRGGNGKMIEGKLECEQDFACAGDEWPACIFATEESTVAYAVEHPMSHFIDRNATKENLRNWLFLQGSSTEAKQANMKDDLWGGSGAEKTAKTMYDPCPVGYCVPSAAQVKALNAAGYVKADCHTADGYFGKLDALWFHRAGSLVYSEKEEDCYGCVFQSLSNGYYHSSDAFRVAEPGEAVTSSKYDGVWGLMYTTSVAFGKGYARATGSPIRCVKI